MAKRDKREITDSAITDPRTATGKISPSDSTDPRAARPGTNAVDWNLPTIAATVEEVHALMQRRRSSVSGAELPQTRFGRWCMALLDLASANPLATFAAGFACACLIMILVWTLAK